MMTCATGRSAASQKANGKDGGCERGGLATGGSVYYFQFIIFIHYFEFVLLHEREYMMMGSNLKATLRDS